MLAPSRFRRLLTVPAACLFGIVLGVSPARAEFVVGLTSANSLIFFDTATPGAVSAPRAITGIGNESLYDIDYRPANGLLYAFSNAGRLYSVDTNTGAATLSATLAAALDPSATRFSIDFNPTVDRLRIVSNTGQDFRLTPGTSVTNIDGALNGAAGSALSVAYTNNDNDPATGTTLYYIGPNTATTLYNTADPNNGVLATVGSLGASGTQSVGFDVSGLTGQAFASLTSPTGGSSSLYRINLASGAATLVGGIGSGVTVNGIALLPAAVPEPSSLVLAGFGVAALAARALRFRKGRQV